MEWDDWKNWTNLEWADWLENLWSDDCDAHLLPKAAAALRNLHTENTALRVTEDNLRQELQECQDQRRAAFRRIEELDATRAQIGHGEPVAWSPALDYPQYEKERVWCNGKPRQEDIDYWEQHGNGITLAYTHPAPQQNPLTDEQDRALCEAYCNAASGEYFKARPQLDSDVNRRIFYAGHRKAWIEWQAAHNIGEKK